MREMLLGRAELLLYWSMQIKKNKTKKKMTWGRQENNSTFTRQSSHLQQFQMSSLVCTCWLETCGNIPVILKRNHKPAALFYPALLSSEAWDAAQCLWASQNATSRAGHTHTHTRKSPCCYGNKALKRGKEFWRMQKKIPTEVLTCRKTAMLETGKKC